MHTFHISPSVQWGIIAIAMVALVNRFNADRDCDLSMAQKVILWEDRRIKLEHVCFVKYGWFGARNGWIRKDDFDAKTQL